MFTLLLRLSFLGRVQSSHLYPKLDSTTNTAPVSSLKAQWLVPTDPHLLVAERELDKDGIKERDAGKAKALFSLIIKTMGLKA